MMSTLEILATPPSILKKENIFEDYLGLNIAVATKLFQTLSNFHKFWKFFERLLNFLNIFQLPANFKNCRPIKILSHPSFAV